MLLKSIRDIFIYCCIILFFVNIYYLLLPILMIVLRLNRIQLEYAMNFIYIFLFIFAYIVGFYLHKKLFNFNKYNLLITTGFVLFYSLTRSFISTTNVFDKIFFKFLPILFHIVLLIGYYAYSKIKIIINSHKNNT